MLNNNTVYFKKYKKYKNKYIQTKEEYLDDNLKKYIDDVQKNVVNYNFENKNFVNLLNRNLNCSDRNFIESDDEENAKFMTYDKIYNLKFGCFVAAQDNTNYVFKSTLKGQMTDIFVNTLGDKLFEVFTLQIIDIMNEMVSYYIKNFNDNNSYKLKEDDIVYLYKGGNIIRMNIDEMLGNFSSNIISSCTPFTNIKKIIEVIDTVKSKQKYGDWDMIVYINPDLDHNIYHKIESDLNKILLPVLQKLKISFNDLIFNKFSHNFLEFLNKVHFSYFEDSDFIQVITDYDKHLILDNIKSFDYLIKKDGICKQENIKLEKKPFVTLDRPGTPVKNYVELGNIYAQDHGNINNINNTNNTNNTIGVNATDLQLEMLLKNENILDEVSDTIFLTQSKALVVVREFKIPFTISRLKVNNISTLKRKMENINISLPFELIDAVVLDQNDSQGKYIHNKLHTYHKPLTTISNYFGKKLRLPSVYYLYYDLEAILMRQNVFIWEDKKYGKRLLRLLMLALYASIKDNLTIDYIFNNVKLLLDLFNNTRKLPNNKKLQSLHNIYYISQNKIYLKNNYNMQYFGELIEHYVHCILCINTLINNQLNNNPYVLNIFRTNINYTPITGSLFLTKPIKYYLDTSNQEYFEKLSEYENEVINYLEIISYLLKNLSPEKLKLHNDIIKL